MRSRPIPTSPCCACSPGSAPAPTSSPRASCGARSPPACRPSASSFPGSARPRRRWQRRSPPGSTRSTSNRCPELHRLSAVATKLGRTAPIALRVNPDVDALTHAKIATGKKENKFGIDLGEAAAAYRLAASLPGIAPVGLAVHIGSQAGELAPFREAFTRLARAGAGTAGERARRSPASISAAASASAIATSSRPRSPITRRWSARSSPRSISPSPSSRGGCWPARPGCSSPECFTSKRGWASGSSSSTRR